MLYIVECEERIVAFSDYLVEAQDQKMARSILLRNERESIIDRMETIEEVVHIKKILSIKKYDDTESGKSKK